jgi:3-oxoadipate enol-lactonase
VSGATEGVARLADGTRLGYRLHDAGAAAPRVALVHSLAMDRDFWAPVVAELGGAASVLVYDCRGHGASDRPPGPYTVELFADDLAGLMDAIGWPNALVAGASMGGCVSLAFAARHPARTTALGLIDTTAWYGPEAPKNWAERGRAAAAGFEAMVDFQAQRWFAEGFYAEHPDRVRVCIDAFLRNDAAAYAESCRMLGAADLRAVLPAIRVPTAIVVGAEDYATPPAMAEALHAGIRGSTLTVLDGARHLTPVERPEAIAAALRTLMPAPRQAA